MQNITDEQFYLLFGDAIDVDDRDAYVSDWALSTIWGDASDMVPLIPKLEQIWDVAHMSVGDIRRTTGLTQVQFAQRFCVPRRTLQTWEHRGATPYIRLMLARLCGLI